MYDLCVWRPEKEYCDEVYKLFIYLEGSFSKLEMAQQPEGSVRCHTGETPLEAGVEDGQRILCLDGGGCKGLIIIEVLMYIEKLTQRRIVDLFDWIVGTSAGAVIALALVYRRLWCSLFIVAY